MKKCRYEKVVFLDFDGVLNADYTRGLDRDKILRVNRILEETGAVVVVSSDWGINRKLVELRDLLSQAGFIGKVVDKTPKKFSSSHSMEISWWLEDCGRPEKFVVLDDLLLHFGENQIYVNSRTGITDDDVEKAIAILGKK